MTEVRFAELIGAHGESVLSNREDQYPRFWLTGLDGWFGGVGVSGATAQRTFGHGLFREAVKRTGRVLTLKGHFMFDSDADRLVADRFLSGLLWDGDYGELRVTTGDLTLSSFVRLDGEIKHSYQTRNTRELNIQVPLLASDPFLYGVPQVYQVYPAGSGVGLRFPLFSQSGKPGGLEVTEVTPGLSFGAANPNTQGVVQNRGNADSYPRIRIVGDFPSGFVLKNSRGRTIEYPAPVWQQSPVEVDCWEGAVYQGGVNQTYRCTNRQWFTIPAHGVDSFRVSSIAPGDGRAEITHRDTYI